MHCPAWVVVKWTRGGDGCMRGGDIFGGSESSFSRFPAHERTAAAFHRLPSRQPAGQVGKRAVARADPPTEDLSGLDRSAEIEPRFCPRVSPQRGQRYFLAPIRQIPGTSCWQSVHHIVFYPSAANLANCSESPIFAGKGPFVAFRSAKEKRVAFSRKKKLQAGTSSP